MKARPANPLLLLPELTLLAVASLACSSMAGVVRLLDRSKRSLPRHAS